MNFRGVFTDFKSKYVLKVIVYKINKIAKAEEKMIKYFFPEGLS